jgi:hypothetical protein
VARTPHACHSIALQRWCCRGATCPSSGYTEIRAQDLRLARFKVIDCACLLNYPNALAVVTAGRLKAYHSRARSHGTRVRMNTFCTHTRALLPSSATQPQRSLSAARSTISCALACKAQQHAARGTEVLADSKRTVVPRAPLADRSRTALCRCLASSTVPVVLRT